MHVIMRIYILISPWCGCFFEALFYGFCKMNNKKGCKSLLICRCWVFTELCVSELVLRFVDMIVDGTVMFEAYSKWASW